jgi:ADP-heptose:LPS heptosyltransferase
MKVAVFRLSALGDVIMTFRPLLTALEQNAGLEIWFYTKNSNLKFMPIHPRLKVQGLSFRNGLGGIVDLYKLIKKIQTLGFDKVLDLHDVNRTKILRFLLSLRIPVFKLDKGRKEKKQYVSGYTKNPLKNGSQRYAEVFEEAGLSCGQWENVFVDFGTVKPNYFKDSFFRVGIAPFAAHETKVLPLEKYKAVFSYFQEKKPDLQFYIFGFGAERGKWNEVYPEAAFSNVINTINTLDSSTELSLISSLDLMLSMDSANMHLADALGLKVLSIWGPTHPDLGFKPEKVELIQKFELSCRPCSVYGNKACHRKDHACMQNIESDEIIREIERKLSP